MSRISKADEATTWRRTTPVTNDSHNLHNAPNSTSKHSYARPATAGSSNAYSRMPQQPAASLQLMPLRQPVPTDFNVVEAQALLEQRWAALCHQGLTPKCQCQEQQAGAGNTDSLEHVSKGSSNFLQELKAAAELEPLKAAAECKLAPAEDNADAAWDDP